MTEIESRILEIREAAVFYSHCADVARGGGNLAQDERQAQAYDRRAFALNWAATILESKYFKTCGEHGVNPGLREMTAHLQGGK